MTEQTIKSIQEALTPLAAKVGESAAAIYAIYTKQMLIEGVVALVTAPVWILIMFWIYHKTRSVWMHRKELQREGVTWQPFMLGGIIVLIILALALDQGIPDALGKILNPQYYALTRILEQVKK